MLTNYQNFLASMGNTLAMRHNAEYHYILTGVRVRFEEALRQLDEMQRGSEPQAPRCAAEYERDPQIEARVTNIEREIHNSLKKTAELHGKELQEQFACVQSEFTSALADVRDECEKLRTNERQITEYVNKIRVDLDAITTDKTCVVVLGQCVSELRKTLTNAQLAGQLEVNKINDRLAKLEEYCHTHYVDATGACCLGEPVVGIGK